MTSLNRCRALSVCVVALLATAGCSNGASRRTNDQAGSSLSPSATTGSDESRSPQSQSAGSRASSSLPSSSNPPTTSAPRPDSRNGTPPVEPGSFAADRRNELVSFQDAAGWWPFRPLLREPGDQSHTVWSVNSDVGGRRGSASASNSGIDVIHETANKTVYSSSFVDIVKDGGSMISAFSPSTSQMAAVPGAETVSVRGVQGRTWVQSDLRLVSWVAKADNGQEQQWLVVLSKTYSAKAAASWVDALVKA